MKISYRPELDGLRAIAVTAVIFYHSKITFFNKKIFDGGFVGVDIFFVISGYLITSIIINEFNTTGSLSLKNFYERRIRRIFPVLIFVILFSLPFAWRFLMPSSLIDFSKSILYSLSFISNFYFWHSGQLYGAENGLLKPFLHTWSLSVEEQFYIIFPVITLIIFKYLKKYFISLIIFTFLLSLGLADFGSKNYPSFTFYVLFTRVWEILAGSILAYYEISRGYRSKNETLNKFLPFVGSVFILYSIFSFDHKTFHPSINTLLPIIGVCLIIWFSNRDGLINKILCTKPFLGIGIISYSLYMWHYPIFAFGRVININPNQIDLFLWIFLTTFVSIISYYLIEKPFREKKNKFKPIFILLTILISIIVIIQIFFINNKSKIALKSGADGVILSENQKIGNGNDRFIIFGDSHAQHVMSYLKDIALSDAENISFYNVTHTACISLPNITNYYNPTGKKFELRKSCTNLYKNINEIFKKEKELVVVLYNTWFKHIIRNNSKIYNEDLKFNDDPKHNEKIIKVILDDIIKLRKINNASKKWIVVGKNPGSYNYSYDKGFLQCYNSKKTYSKQPYIELEKCEKKGLIEDGLNYNEHKMFKEIIQSNYNKDIVYLDSYELYCDYKYCNNFDEFGKLIYYDHHHFTYEGSKKIANKILKIFNEIK